MARRQASVGLLLALGAAVAFGCATPAVQRFGRGVGPFTTAALLYLGAALFALPTRSGRAIEAPLRAAHAPRLAAIVLAGGALAPAMLAWGLARASGARAGLLLCLEAPLTAVLGALLNGEHVGRRVAGALACMAAGAALLVVAGGPLGAGGGASALGLLAIGGAAFAWALDNALTAPLSALDASRIVLVKGGAGAVLSLSIALAIGEPRVAIGPAAGLVLTGATGYGASLRLYILAQRRLGAARTASIFSAAPFVAAGAAAALGQPVGLLTVVAAAPMLAGLWLHASERHAHRHTHPAVEHEHAHTHDDGHHTHRHDGPIAASHSHVHRHDELAHDHEHAADADHVHRH